MGKFINKTNASSGAVYGIGMIGALVYYLTTATGFLDGLFGIFQAMFWPAYLIYGALKALGM